MNKDIDGCRNGFCQAYQDNECKRAIRHKEAIKNREEWVFYIPARSNETQCELYLEVEK
jgi:hypothetical protein